MAAAVVLVHWSSGIRAPERTERSTNVRFWGVPARRGEMGKTIRNRQNPPDFDTVTRNTILETIRKDSDH